MTEEERKARTKRFALEVMRVVELLPKTTAGRAIGGQLVRSGTSVGSNYRAACRGRSKAEFVAKVGIVTEEADECACWLEPIMEARLLQPELVKSLRREAEELTAIFMASGSTARKNL